MSIYLPTEVIDHSLSYLSPKELASVATVRQSWSRLVTRLLYRNVDIYSTSQYDRFIKGLRKNDKRNSSDMDKNGHQVRRLCLHTVHIMLSSSQIKTLKRLCPLINEFDYGPGVPIGEEHLCHFIPGWEHLTRLPSWHEDKHKKWIPKLGGQLTHVYCFIEELAFLPSFINTTPLFPKLVELKLSLQYFGPPISVSWMEMLNDQCPALTTLDVEFTDYELGGGLKGDWKPAPKLRRLAWRIDGICDPIWYTYLSQKYPNICDLEFQLGVDGYFDEFPGGNDQQLNEWMRGIHSDCIFNLVTNLQQLSSLKILLESKQPSYLNWFPLTQLSTWLGTPTAKHIKNLYWRTDPYQLGMAGSRAYDYEDDASGNTMVVADKLDPLGNIKALEKLAYDVHEQVPGSVTSICSGTLVLENLASLELFFSRKYENAETFEHLDMNLILNGCPHLETLGLAGVNCALICGTPSLQKNQQEMNQQYVRHWKLTHLRIHHAILSDDDYLSNLLKRCPNVTKLKLYDCRVYQLRILQRQQTRQAEFTNDSKSFNTNVYTIHAPDHSLSLVDIRGLRLMTFADAPDGDLFCTLFVVQQRGETALHHRSLLDADGNNNSYTAELICRYADTVLFPLHVSLGDNVYHDY